MLTSAAHVLNDGYNIAGGASSSMLSQPEYVHLLQQYARQHTKTLADPDTADPKGSGHIYEVLHPDLGYWIDHQDGDTEMGEDYNHSTFIDLVLSGLFGLRPRGDVRQFLQNFLFILDVREWAYVGAVCCLLPSALKIGRYGADF